MGTVIDPVKVIRLTDLPLLRFHQELTVQVRECPVDLHSDKIFSNGGHIRIPLIETIPTVPGTLTFDFIRLVNGSKTMNRAQVNDYLPRWWHFECESDKADVGSEISSTTRSKRRPSQGKP